MILGTSAAFLVGGMIGLLAGLLFAEWTTQEPDEKEDE